jgi:hypothetical protein
VFFGVRSGAKYSGAARRYRGSRWTHSAVKPYRELPAGCSAYRATFLWWHLVAPVPATYARESSIRRLVTPTSPECSVTVESLLGEQRRHGPSGHRPGTADRFASRVPGYPLNTLRSRRSFRACEETTDDTAGSVLRLVRHPPEPQLCKGQL